MRHSILAVLLLLLGLPALAVTDREMEEAKTITAITYLRYANDLSGYLDDHHPKTMAELEAILKPKEKENLKTFTAVKTPTDYASWDKEKLVGYWAGTFYSSPGLLAKGKIGKSRTRSRLNAMKVSAPQQAKAESPKPQAETPQQTAETQQPRTESPDTQGETRQPQTEPTNPQAPTEQPQTESSQPQVDPLIEQANADAGLEEEERPRKNNSTWIYIVILALLVGVVVWLVVYASKTMRREDQRRRQEEVENGTAAVSDNIAERTANAAMREKYSESLNQKNTELRQAQKEVADLHAEIEELRVLNARQAEEITRLRNGLAAMAGTAPQPSNPGTQAADRQPQASSPRPQAERPASRTIYLGRVNQRGLFVRADKTPHPDLSVYSLQTEDGYTGTFRVIENADIDRRLLDNPEEWLSGGCTGLNALASTPDGELINTESGGTAIFEGGAWKVIRKARISFS